MKGTTVSIRPGSGDYLYVDPAYAGPWDMTRWATVYADGKGQYSINMVDGEKAPGATRRRSQLGPAMAVAILWVEEGIMPERGQ
jgi:hypothetical protein